MACKPLSSQPLEKNNKGDFSSGVVVLSLRQLKFKESQFIFKRTCQHYERRRILFFTGFGIRTFSWQKFNKKKKIPQTLMSDWLHSSPQYNTTPPPSPLRHVVFNTAAGTHGIMQPLCFGRPFYKFMSSQYNGSISGFWLCGEIRTRQRAIPLTSGMPLKMFNCNLGVSNMVLCAKKHTPNWEATITHHAHIYAQK